MPSLFHGSDSSVSSGASADLTAKSTVVPDVLTHAISPGPKTSLGDLEANTVTVPASAKLGGEAGCDFDLILNHSRVALGAAAVGLLRAGTEYAVNYAKQRVQFGKPVAQNQSIAFMLAEMATDVDELRMMVWEAAWELDQGKDATRTTTVMKYHMDDLVVKTADQALQTLGGYGYIREYPVELWLRNARGMAIFDGLLML